MVWKTKAYPVRGRGSNGSRGTGRTSTRGPEDGIKLSRDGISPFRVGVETSNVSSNSFLSVRCLRKIAYVIKEDVAAEMAATPSSFAALPSFMIFQI